MKKCEPGIYKCALQALGAAGARSCTCSALRLEADGHRFGTNFRKIVLSVGWSCGGHMLQVPCREGARLLLLHVRLTRLLALCSGH